MKMRHIAVMVLFVSSAASSTMERPYDNHVMDSIRAVTTVGAAGSGIAYLIAHYVQGMNQAAGTLPKTYTMYGFKNPPYRYLSMFFAFTTFNAVAGNICANPLVHKLFMALLRAAYKDHISSDKEL